MPRQGPDGVWRSDDGHYAWNGTAWVPAGTSPVPQRPPARVRWPFYVAAGCAALIVVAVVGAGLIGLAAYLGLRSLGGCPPGDFPIPPNANRTFVNVNAGTGGTNCSLTYDVGDSSANIDAFYSASHDPWHLENHDEATDTYDLRNGSRTARVRVLGTGRRARIEVEIQT